MSRRYVVSSAAHSLYSLSPFLRGEGWGEGCDPRGSVYPSPPPSPRSKSGERDSGLSMWQGCGSTSAERALAAARRPKSANRFIDQLEYPPVVRFLGTSEQPPLPSIRQSRASMQCADGRTDNGRDAVVVLGVVYRPDDGLLRISGMAHEDMQHGRNGFEQIRP